MAIRPKRALANDINKHLINFYRHVQKGLVIMIPMENEEGMYYSHRKRFNELIVAGGEESEEAASLFHSGNVFGEKEQESLALWLSKHSGPVVASNAATPFVRNLYKDLGFNVVILEAPRRISATGDRTPALELLAWRNVVLSTDLQSILEKTVE